MQQHYCCSSMDSRALIEHGNHVKECSRSSSSSPSAKRPIQHRNIPPFSIMLTVMMTVLLAATSSAFSPVSTSRGRRVSSLSDRRLAAATALHVQNYPPLLEETASSVKAKANDHLARTARTAKKEEEKKKNRNLDIVDGVVQKRYKAITRDNVGALAEEYPALQPHLYDILLAGLVFPFKASPYLVHELIDWHSDKGIKNDPFYKLVFPTLDMLVPRHREKLESAYRNGDPSKLLQVVQQIREELNPNPDGQKDLNVPTDDDSNELAGVQHKYSETVLAFPAAGQTCHAYCTYCFRWSQFVGKDEWRFSQKEAKTLFDYLSKHQEVSDILVTGGDPMIMKTKSLAQYLEPLTDPNFLPHIKNVRIGTRSLTYWPQRFTSDEDADELIDLFRRVRTQGKRHVAIMAHLGHPRELSTQKFQQAVDRLQQEAFVTIRSQCPVMRRINDDANLWAEKWCKEVQMGIVPYYMFVARDTGAQHFFEIPLVEVQKIYSDAIRNCSGLVRTVRGPSMSCTPGKVEVTGVEMIMGHKAFVLRFLQCRDANWIGRVFFARYDKNATWYDDLRPLPGMELPWDEKNGSLIPVPDAVI